MHKFGPQSFTADTQTINCKSTSKWKKELDILEKYSVLNYVKLCYPSRFQGLCGSSSPERGGTWLSAKFTITWMLW